MKYLVSHQSLSSGPFDLAEIVAKIRSKELEMFDYIFDPAVEDWVLLLEFAPVANQLKQAKPTRPPVLPTAPESAERRLEPSAHAIVEWFVLKGEQRFGPFAFGDVVKMLQQKTIFAYDFVWHPGLKSWSRVAEVAELSSSQVRDLYLRQTEREVFVQRRFVRAKFMGKLMIHDGVKLWRGEGFEISRGGVGVKMDNSLVQPGQQLNLHFSPTDTWPAFNAIGEVVSKKFVSDHAPIEYGLKFLTLSAKAQDELFKKVS